MHYGVRLGNTEASRGVVEETGRVRCVVGMGRVGIELCMTAASALLLSDGFIMGAGQVI